MNESRRGLMWPSSEALAAGVEDEEPLRVLGVSIEPLLERDGCPAEAK